MKDQTLKRLKSNIIKASYSAGEGHIPSALSILDLVWILYDKVIKVDPKKPGDITRDRFVLSKGHASLALYAVLAEKGFFEQEKLALFCKYDSILGGHPDCNKVPGVEASTGSLGHGFPMAVGMALGSTIKGLKNKIFCLVGDGECNEGTVWEAALLASHHRLSNLVCIVDYNRSTDRALDLGDLNAKFNAFGWITLRINGHDQLEIFNALTHATNGKPLAVIAETLKGNGVACMENNPAWHHRSPTEMELGHLLEELSKV